MSLPELKVKADLASAASSLIADAAKNNLLVDGIFRDGIDALRVVSLRFLSLAIVMSPVEDNDVVPPELR